MNPKLEFVVLASFLSSIPKAYVIDRKVDRKC